MKMSNVFIVLFLCISAYAITWSEPKKLPYRGWPVTVDNQGVLWCLSYIEGLYRYIDEASGWKLVIDSPPFGGELCFDKADTLWVITVNYTEVYYTRYDGEQWHGPDTVPAFEYAYYGIPHITADSTGGVWVGWTTLERWYFHQANFNRYKDGKWGEPGFLSDTSDGSDHGFGAITTDALGRVWFAWTIPSKFVATYWDQSFWSDKTVILDMTDTLWGSGNPIWLNLVPDHQGGVWAYMNYRNRDSKDVYVMANYWDGETWSEPDTIALAGPFYGDSPNDIPPWGKMAVDKYGNLWAVWRQAVVEKDSLGDIYYSVNKDSGWSEPEPVDVNPALDYNADIAIDGDGRVWCVWVSNRYGEDEYDDNVWASYTTIDGVEEEETEPIKPGIISISPNPTRSHAIISYSVGGISGSKETEHVEIAIFDASGRKIKTLVSGKESPGRYSAVWNATDNEGRACPYGVYFISLHSADFQACERVVLIK